MSGTLGEPVDRDWLPRKGGGSVSGVLRVAPSPSPYMTQTRRWDGSGMHRLRRLPVLLVALGALALAVTGTALAVAHKTHRVTKKSRLRAVLNDTARRRT